MTPTRYLLLAASALLSHQAAAQGLITGRVLDRQTHQPVPYASVVVAGTTQGTTTNAEGEFGLRVARLPAKVLAFSLGYGRDSVTVAAAGPTPPLALQAAPVALPAVEPTSYAAQLLAKAYQQVQRSRIKAAYGQAFYRQVTRNGDEPTEVLEAVWDVKTSSAGLDGTRLAQGRYAAQPAALLNFTNFSLYTKVFGGFCGVAAADTTASHAVINTDASQFYVLQLKGLMQSGGRPVAEIAFTSRPGIPTVSGSVFVDVTTYQVLHARATRPIEMSASKKSFSFKDALISVEADFRTTPGEALPNYVKASSSLTVSRPHKPDVPVRVESFTFFYDSQPVPTGLPYAGPNAPLGDLAAIKQKAYDPAFWQANPVVKRTPLEDEIIQSLEQKKSFGTLLTK